MVTDNSHKIRPKLTHEEFTSFSEISALDRMSDVKISIDYLKDSRVYLVVGLWGEGKDAHFDGQIDLCWSD